MALQALLPLLVSAGAKIGSSLLNRRSEKKGKSPGGFSRILDSIGGIAGGLGGSMGPIGSAVGNIISGGINPGSGGSGDESDNYLGGNTGGYGGGGGGQGMGGIQQLIMGLLRRRGGGLPRGADIEMGVGM